MYNNECNLINEIKRSDCKILLSLYQEDCFDAFHAITASHCSSITKLCETKVRKTLNEFIEKKYVSLGYKKSQARTFYITELGIDVLKTIMPAGEI